MLPHDLPNATVAPGPPRPDDCGPTRAQTLVVNVFDEDYAKVHQKCVIEPFQSETGARVDTIVASSAKALEQLRVNEEAPIYDVVHFSGGQEIPASREGLLSAISEATLGNTSEVYGFATNLLWRGRGPIYLVEPLGLIHNTLNNAADLASWKGLADPAIAKEVVLQDISSDEGMLAFLMLNKVMGGDLDNVQPGLKAVAMMVAEGAKVVSSNNAVLTAFKGDVVHYGAHSPNTAYELQEAKVPVAYKSGAEGTPAKFYTANLVSNRPNQTLSIRLIDLTLSAPAQRCFAEALRLSPTNSTVTLPAGIARDVPKGPAAVERLERFDGREIDRHRAEWIKLWKIATEQE